MESLKKIKEVNVVEEYIAIMNLLGELGYETEQLTVFQVAEIKRNIFQAIKGVEQ
jgi:hypothetical protein